MNLLIDMHETSHVVGHGVFPHIPTHTLLHPYHWLSISKLVEVENFLCGSKVVKASSEIPVSYSLYHTSCLMEGEDLDFAALCCSLHKCPEGSIAVAKICWDQMTMGASAVPPFPVMLFVSNLAHQLEEHILQKLSDLLASPCLPSSYCLAHKCWALFSPPVSQNFLYGGFNLLQRANYSVEGAWNQQRPLENRPDGGH